MKSITLPEVPKDISPEIKEQKYIKYDIEKPELHSVEKVGERLIKYQQCSESGFDKFYEVENKNENEDLDDDSDYEEESPELLKLNPYNWKSQDHYAVLGLSKLRINATDEDIKKAYRKKVLRHHPDKKASDGNSNNDSFFKCIQKAYEIITDPVKRRQFDSVDPEFDESIPTKCSKEDFFEILTPVFERNARFSNIQPVPSLGDMNSTREEVEEFYRFWSNFDSWRSFEYLDEEDADSYENREDRRYFERKNKNARAKHKKEDNQRIINLIDLAVRTDPRLALYKKADREAKEAKRLEKRAAQIAAAEEEKKRKEEEEKAKERAIIEEQERIAKEKKEKEMKKRVVKKEKKTLKKFLQDNNYLIDPATPATPEQIESQLKKLDEYVSQMDADNLTAYRVYLIRAYENGWEAASTYFNEDHLNEGEKYAAELAEMAPVEEVKEEIKGEIVVETIKEEKKEPEIEKIEVVEEKKEPEVKKPEVAKMLKKLPSISRIGGMRRTKKKIIRKEYDSEEEEEERERERERELEKEKEQSAPATSSKKKNKKKKKSKKKNSSEELKVNVEEDAPAIEENTEVKEVTAPTEEPSVVEEVKEEATIPVEEPAVVEEVKEEITVPAEEPAVVEEVKEEVAVPAEEPVVVDVRGMYKVEPVYGIVPEIDTKTKMYNVKSIYGDNVNVDLPLTASERENDIEEKPVEKVEPVIEKQVQAEEPVVEEVAVPAEESVVVEEVKEEITPVEEEKKEAPVETKPETKKSKKMKKKKSKAKLEVAKPKEEKKEEKREEKKEEKKPQEPVKPKEEILKEVKKQEEENAKRIKDILKKKMSMGKLRSKKSSRKLREEKKEEEKKEEQKEELTISFSDDRKKTKAERKAEKEAKKAAKKAKELEEAKAKKESAEEKTEASVAEEPAKSENPVEEIKEEVKEETPVETPVTEEPVIEESVENVVAETPIEIRGMYKVKPVYGVVPKIDTKTKMYTVKSIYGDDVVVDLPLTANQRATGEETYGVEEDKEPEEKVEVIEEVNEDKTEVVEKVEVVEEVTEDKTEVEEKTEEIEETSEEKTEIIEIPSSEEKIEVETVKEPVKEEIIVEKTKNLRRCPSGISLKPWTPEQQAKLEEALVKFPSVQFKENPMERWIEISNYVGRSRTDIKFRIKDLAETIRRKRSIQSLKNEN